MAMLDRFEVRGTEGGYLPAATFTKFVQDAQARSGPQTGLGIGLWLVRKLVELHHGTIEAASAGPGQGSTFTLRLPLAPPT